MANIEIPLLLHAAQRVVFNDPHRFRLLVNGRRWGKTALGITELVIRALSYEGVVDPRFPVNVLGILPTAIQARTVIWKPLLGLIDTPNFAPLVKRINRTSMSVDLNNGVTIRVVGANDSGGDRLRGMKIYFALFDEMQDCYPAAFFEVVRPAMSDSPGSRALFTGTPKGRSNILYKLSQLQENDPDWSVWNFPTSSNPLIPREEIERARLTLPPRLFNQEYLGHWVDFPGKIYTELDIANKYYGTLPQFDLVIAGVDFGDLFPCISVIGRGVDRKFYYLEGWSPNADSRNAQPIPEPVLHANIRRLVKKWGIKNIYCDPSRPSAILGIRSLGDETGYRNAVAAFNPIWPGIEQIHSLITQKTLLFSAGQQDRVKDAIDGEEAYQLHESYHRLTDKNGNFTETVADGFFAHCVDSVRYCLAVKSGRV